MNNETNASFNADKEIQRLLEEVAREEGFSEFKIDKAAGSVQGDGYAGIITSVKIIEKDDANNSNTLNLIVKSASQSDAFRTKVPVASVFDREIYMYDTVFSTFQMFEIEKRLLPSFFAPKLYKVNKATKTEAIILENLKERGYVLHERRIPMDDSHVSLVLTEYGRLHALSFALRDQHPDKFEQIIRPLDDVLTKFLRENIVDTLIHRCTKAVESLDPNTDQEAIKRFGKLIDGIVPFLDELRESVDDVYSVALHGDCWTNNMMFNYEDNSNPTKPTKVRFIDFQVSKLGSPALDLVYFFYACSSKKIINNVDNYMRIYYSSLSTYLQKLGSDPDKMYPYSVLQQQWKKNGKFGLIMSVLVIHAMLTEKDEVIDLKDIAESGQSVSKAFNYEIANVDKYNDRIRPIILHFVENNLI